MIIKVSFFPKGDGVREEVPTTRVLPGHHPRALLRGESLARVYYGVQGGSLGFIKNENNFQFPLVLGSNNYVQRGNLKFIKNKKKIDFLYLATAAAVADPQKIRRPANAGLLYSHNRVAVFRVSG